MTQLKCPQSITKRNHRGMKWSFSAVFRNERSLKNKSAKSGHLSGSLSTSNAFSRRFRSKYSVIKWPICTLELCFQILTGRIKPIFKTCRYFQWFLKNAWRKLWLNCIVLICVSTFKLRSCFISRIMLKLFDLWSLEMFLNYV